MNKQTRNEALIINKNKGQNINQECGEKKTKPEQ